MMTNNQVTTMMKETKRKDDQQNRRKAELASLKERITATPIMKKERSMRNTSKERTNA